jgi:hypothetical protein
VIGALLQYPENAWYLLLWVAAPKSADALFSWVTGPVFSTFRTATGPISFLSLSGHFDEIFPTRVSSDNPRLKAFCRVAPSVLFILRAISAARFLLRASLFKVRICSAVHARLFICSPQSKRLLPPLIARIKSTTDPDSDVNHSYLYLPCALANNRHQNTRLISPLHGT